MITATRQIDVTTYGKQGTTDRTRQQIKKEMSA
jgi:hypothetical protein